MDPVRSTRNVTVRECDRGVEAGGVVTPHLSSGNEIVYHLLSEKAGFKKLGVNRMSDTENTQTEATVETNTQVEVPTSYHAVEKDGNVTAIWEMQGDKHIRTIDPRSAEGKQILALFETAA